MQLPRMTTRKWMVTVLIVGTILGACIIRRQARTYRALASRCAAKEAYCLKRIAMLGPLMTKQKRSLAEWKNTGTWNETHQRKLYKDLLADLAWQRRQASYWGRMRHLYEDAAARPWNPLPPEPPEPSAFITDLLNDIPPAELEGDDL